MHSKSYNIYQNTTCACPETYVTLMLHNAKTDSKWIVCTRDRVFISCSMLLDSQSNPPIWQGINTEQKSHSSQSDSSLWEQWTDFMLHNSQSDSSLWEHWTYFMLHNSQSDSSIREQWTDFMLHSSQSDSPLWEHWTCFMLHNSQSDSCCSRKLQLYGFKKLRLRLQLRLWLQLRNPSLASAS